MKIRKSILNYDSLHATVPLCILNFAKPRVANLRFECREGICGMLYRLK